MDDLVVFCADVGSVRAGNFGSEAERYRKRLVRGLVVQPEACLRHIEVRCQRRAGAQPPS